MTMRFVPAVASLALLIATPIAAHAQQWPTKPVTIVVPFAAGGTADLGTRAMAEGLSKIWKQNVNVENKPGGGTMIGMNAVAKAAPDGYTLGAFTNSLLTNPSVRSNVPYDVFKDLVGVSMIIDSPMAIGVTASLPVKTLNDLIAEAKKSSTPMAFATPGLASVAHMAGEQIQRRTGIKLKHVPYNGTALAIPDLISGRVPVVITTWPDIKAYVDAGQLRALAILGPNRVEDRMELPVASETLPGLSMRAYTGLTAPSGTPKDVLAKMSADIKTVANSPEYIARIKQLGNIPWYTTLEETAQLWKNDSELMAKIAKEENIKID